MDPRLRQVLLVLLSMAVEQIGQEQVPDKKPPPAPGTLEYWNQQLTMPHGHYAWPRYDVDHNFGNP